MKIKEQEKLVGGLSNPSKMPGLSYGTPASACPIGAILRKKAGTVCEGCYAHKGMYVFPVVKKAQARRLEILSSDLETWRVNMTELLSRKYAKKSGPDAVFRWHDSGDIQSAEHLSAIVQIAKDLPGIAFWLPTKEYKVVREYLSRFPIPSNLVIRVSAPMVGQTIAPIPGTVSSTVGTGTGHGCPAPTQGNECGDCRACWDPLVANVDYHKH